MPWPRRLCGLPLHPLLVHFPVAFWLALPFLDLLVLVGNSPFWWRLALGTTAVGVAIGAGAVVTGLLDYVYLSNIGSNDVRLAARHGVRTSLVWCTMSGKLIAVALLGRAAMEVASLVVDLLAGALLLQAIYFGTRLVYHGDR